MTRYNILQLTTGSAIGGTEKMVLCFLENACREKYNLHAASIVRNGPLMEQIDALGVPTLSLDMESGGVAGTGRALSRHLAEKNVHLVHIYGLKGNVIGRIAAKYARVPVIVSGIRGIDAWRRWHHVLLDRLTAPTVTHFIANSRAAREVAIKREKLPPGKISVIPNGIRPPEMPSPESAREARARLGIPEDAPVVGMVANIRPGKGHDVLLRAAPLITSALPGARFLVVGRDFMEGEVQRAVEEMGLDGSFVFAGFRGDVTEQLGAMDLFALPSHAESMPTSILEAMSMGKAVVASRVGGIPEVVSEGETGLLTPPGDPEAFAGAVIRLLHGPEEARKMGQAGRRRVEEEFTQERMVGRIEEVYDRLLKEHARDNT